jgi:hypothetical protein
MALKYTNILIARPSKIYPNWEFGLKICHLAILSPYPECLAAMNN